jgi:ATP-binding cassette, subfamily B, bacterial CvaB/MchF/RaxB
MISGAIRALRLTRIVVAHRPETIAECDRAIYLDVEEDRKIARLADKREARLPA